jgi:hypothetical protein
MVHAVPSIAHALPILVHRLPQPPRGLPDRLHELPLLLHAQPNEVNFLQARLVAHHDCDARQPNGVVELPEDDERRREE